MHRNSQSVTSSETLVEMLRRRADVDPDRRAYEFHDDEDAPAATLTFGELDCAARAIGAMVQSLTKPGDRVLLLHPAGLDYVTAFYGCLYAGVVAVPAFPPEGARAARGVARIQAITADADATLALTTRAILDGGVLDAANDARLSSVRTIASDTLPSGGEVEWVEPQIMHRGLALLQYTSGSTTSPRGVMLTHENMLANAAIQKRAWRLSESSVGVSWLPLYHDLGMISCLVQPVYSGFVSVMMSPAAFLQKPLRWLRAITRSRGTFAGGPNFAFDLCVRKTTAFDRDELDLSSWDCAYNGAEPIRPETLTSFCEAFAPSGFRREAMYPCYGLAEANFVSGGLVPHAPPVVTPFVRADLEHGRANPADRSAPSNSVRSLVGCGTWQAEQDVRVVNPESREVCLPGELGEIWVGGPSVAEGYWRRKEESETSLGAHLAGVEGARYLRTGDLGFVRDGELYVAGRLKDLIIVRGLNHYPQDIERTVERAHPRLRAGCGAAFSIDADGVEQLAVVQEFDGDVASVDEVFARIRQAVAEEHDLQLFGAVLLRPGGIPKTTSGKIQRGASRAGFVARSLDAVAMWTLPKGPPDRETSSCDAPAASGGSRSAQSREAVEAWLIAWIARWLKVDPAGFDVRQPLASYGFHSLHAMELSGDLEEWLGRRVPTTIAYAHPTVTALAAHLAAHSAGDDR